MTRQNFIAQNVNFKQQVLDSFTQQLIIHVGIIATIMDSACGYAAFSLMPAGAEVLSIEFKISPAVGEKFVASAKVIRPGKILWSPRASFTHNLLHKLNSSQV